MTFPTILALSWLPASAVLAVILALLIASAIPRSHQDRQKRPVQGQSEGGGVFNHRKEPSK